LSLTSAATKQFFSRKWLYRIEPFLCFRRNYFGEDVGGDGDDDLDDDNNNNNNNNAIF